MRLIDWRLAHKRDSTERRHGGPESTRTVAMWFVEKPNQMRVLGAVQVVLGLWLALRQHRDI